jgi:hypothetical protein
MDADIEEIDERSDEEDQRYRQRRRKQGPRPHALHVWAPQRPTQRFGIGLTDDEKADLVAFLLTL